MLYRLLELLEVRRIINRHCPSAAQVDQGAVVGVLVLNRLMAPRPLYKVADWLGQTVRAANARNDWTKALPRSMMFMRVTTPWGFANPGMRALPIFVKVRLDTH